MFWPDMNDRPIGDPQTSMPESVLDTVRMAQDKPVHKGMFGLKGTARDIIGAIGDAFLVQGGAKPMYQQRRQMERESDALQGFVDNPLAAIERMAQENPEAALEMYNDFATQERYKTQEARQRRDSDDDYTDRVLQRAGNLMAAANDGNRSQVSAQVENYLKAKGVTSPVPIEQLVNYGYSADKRIDDQRMAQRDADRNNQFSERLSYLEGRDAANREVRREGYQVRTSEGEATRKSRESIAAMSRDERRRQFNRRSAAVTTNKRGETVIIRNDNTVTTARDSVFLQYLPVD